MQEIDQPGTFSEYVKRFEELKTVFDSLPDGVIAILDANMNIASANKAIAEMLQLPLKKIIGRKAEEIFKKNLPGLVEVLKETIKTRKGVRNYTIEIVAPSGDANSFLVSTAIIEELDASETGVVLILHDVSEMARLRKLTLQMDRYSEIIGRSEKMKKIYALIEMIKNYESSILSLRFSSATGFLCLGKISNPHAFNKAGFLDNSRINVSPESHPSRYLATVQESAEVFYQADYLKGFLGRTPSPLRGRAFSGGLHRLVSPAKS